MKLLVLLFVCANTLKLHKDIAATPKPTIKQFVKAGLQSAVGILQAAENKLHGKRALKQGATTHAASQTNTFTRIIDTYTEGKLLSAPPARFANTTIELSAEEIASINHPVAGGGGGWHFQSFNPIGVWVWSAGSGCFFQSGCEPGLTQYARIATSAAVPWFSPSGPPLGFKKAEAEFKQLSKSSDLGPSDFTAAAGVSSFRVNIPCSFHCLPHIGTMMEEVRVGKALEVKKICNDVHLMARGFDEKDGKPKTVEVAGMVLAFRPEVDRSCVKLASNAIMMRQQAEFKQRKSDFDNDESNVADFEKLEQENTHTMTELSKMQQSDARYAKWYSERLGLDCAEMLDSQTEAQQTRIDQLKTLAAAATAAAALDPADTGKAAAANAASKEVENLPADQSQVGVDPNLDLFNELLIQTYGFGLTCNDFFDLIDMGISGAGADARMAVFDWQLNKGGMFVVEVTTNEILLKTKTCGISFSAKEQAQKGQPLLPNFGSSSPFMATPEGQQKKAHFTLGVSFNGVQSTGPMNPVCPAQDILQFFPLAQLSLM